MDAFISVSNAYADEMEKRLQLDRQRLHVVHIGVEAETYDLAPIEMDPPILGYMARMSEGCGLGQLVDAFVELKKRPENSSLRLHVTGGKTHDDDSFIAGLKQKMEKAGVLKEVLFADDFGADGRRAFLEKLSLLSVPGSDQSAFGLYILEAMAAGVPVVEPDIGGFAEIVEVTGGGLIYDPGDPEGLVSGIGSLLADRERTRELGRRAREGVLRHFSLDGMIDQVVSVYGEAVGRNGEGMGR